MRLPRCKTWTWALVLAGAVVCLAAPSAPADMRYATPGATGAGPTCPETDPCPIRTAIAGASLADTVLLGPGTYDLAGGSPIVVASDLTVRPSQPGTRPRIVNDGERALSVLGAATLTALRVEGSGLPSGFGIVHLGSDADAVLRRMIISSPSLPGSQAIQVESGRLELINSGIYVDGAGVNGIDFYDGGPGVSMIRNSTLVAEGSFSTGIEVNSPYGASSYAIDVINTIAIGEEFGIKALDPNGSDGANLELGVQHSNFTLGNSPGDDAIVSRGPGNQSAPPRLANPAAGNFAQRATSRTIDAGLDDGLSGPFDLLGGPRVRGTAIDIGAHETRLQPDTTPPETTITSAPEGTQRTGRRRANARFGFSSSEPGSSFECKLDRGAWRPCATPYKTKVRAKRRVKRHVFRVRATDRAGNTDRTPAKAAWKLVRRR